MRHLALLALAVLSCAPPTPAPCGPGTCSGCCDAAGLCQAGVTDTSCGSQGRVCRLCDPTTTCTLGDCTRSSSGGGVATGGGLAGGTAGGSAAGGDAGGSVAGGSAGGSVAGGSAGGSVAGGIAGGSGAGGSAGGSVAGGSAGGSVAGGSAGGSVAGGGAGGSVAGGSAAGGAAGGSVMCNTTLCPSGCCTATGCLTPRTGVGQYTVSGPRPAAWVPLAPATQLPLSLNPTVLSLPFVFDFFGRSVRDVAVSRYGYLLVGGTTDAPTNLPIPHTATFGARTFIAPWWDALVPVTGSSLRWATSGTSPLRSYTIEYRDVAVGSVSGTRISMQVTLFESTGVIRFAYGPTVPSSGSASVGLQHDLGVGVAGLSCGVTGTCTPPTFPANQVIDFVPAQQTNAACGAPGVACGVCGPSDWCTGGQCVQVPCNFLNCQGCCLSGVCVPVSATTTASCGINGAACQACPPGANCFGGVCEGGSTCREGTCADGCCSSATTCVRAISQSTTACGTAGSACRACPSGTTCQAGQCVASNQCLVVSEQALDFGSVAPSCRALTRTVRLTNLCFTNETIASLGLVSPNPEFELVGPAVPFTVAAGTTASFTVSYRPTSAGPDSATLAINGTRTIPLTGNGGTAVNQARFTVPVQSDVLVVLDDSCSMSEEQTALVDNLGAVFGFAFDAGVDFHFGVTTTDNDGAWAGELRDAGTGNFLTHTTRGFSLRYADLILAGVNGSGIESGLATGLKALTPPRTTSFPNAGFLRHDAALGVWFVSDAPDQSPLLAGAYAEAFRALKADPNRLSVNGLLSLQTSPPPQCLNDGVDVGRYAPLVLSTDGVVEDICPVSWTASLERITELLFGRRQRWTLFTAVDPGMPVSVTIDGVAVPPGPSTWSWDAMANAVRFTRARAPLPGQEVVITSTAPCLP